MSQILYNYPGMKEVVGQMQTQATSLDALGGNVEAEQAALGAAWQGPTPTDGARWHC